MKEFRRERTRTLIQLGGLLDKAKITDMFEIELGQDLQKYDESFDNVAALMGALAEFKNTVDCETIAQQKVLWAEKGKALLAKN